MKKLTLLFATIILFHACRKSDLNEQNTDDKSFKVENKISSATPISSPSLYRGIYLDSVYDMLGDTVKENKVLNWCKANDITTITYYLFNVMGNTNKSGKLASFLKRAKTDYGIRENTAVVPNYDYVINYIDTFNNKIDTLKRFNWCHVEVEWWNKEMSFDDYISNLSSLKTWGNAKTPKVGIEEYIGWFAHPSNQDSLMADKLLKNSDRILVHNYRDSIPVWGYMENRVDYLGKAAYALGKTAQIIPIFSAEDNFSGNYFKQNSFDKGHQAIIDGYNSSTILRKSNTAILGYQLFIYHFARKSRPLVNLEVNNSPSKPINGTVRVYDHSNTLIDTKSFSANINNKKPLKQLNIWRMEIDATNTSGTRHIMEVYINGNFIKSYFVNGNTTTTVMRIPYPTPQDGYYHDAVGNVGIVFYPG